MSIKTEKSFINRFEEAFYLRVRDDINKTLKFNQTDLTSLGLFLHLPLKVSLVKVKTKLTSDALESHFDEAKAVVSKNPTINQSLKDFLKYFSAYVVIESESSYKIDYFVNFSFLYNSDEDLEYFIKSLDNSIIRKFLAFSYIHELQHILRRHNTKSTISIYQTIVESYLRKHNKSIDNIYEFINIAFDYAINYSIFDLIDDKDFIEILKEHILYDKYYHNSQFTELTILKELLDKLDEIKIESKELNTTSKQKKTISTTILLDNIEITKHKEKSKTDDTIDDIEIEIKLDSQINNLSYILVKFINEKSKGSNSQETFKNLGGLKKVKSDWIKELINRIFIITRDITHQYYSTWSSLKNQYRRIGLFPNKKFLKKTVFIYVSIDQSGSMSDNELRKINYLLTVIAKRVGYLHIMIHDSSIVKIFELGQKSDNNSKIDLDDIINKRYSSGGTSHKPIFQYLDDNIKKIDVPQSIYISFSDNDSDIEENYLNYRVIQKIKKFWVTTEREVKVLGKNILMR